MTDLFSVDVLEVDFWAIDCAPSPDIHRRDSKLNSQRSGRLFAKTEEKMKCVLDADHGVHLEYQCREHGAKLVNR